MGKTQQKYKYAVIATDVVIMTIREGALNVLLIEMKKDPFRGMWAVPGGLVGGGEDVDTGAGRILKEKTGLKNIYLEQLYTFGRVDRDPFGRVVSVAYFALLPSDQVKLKASSEYNGIGWFPVGDLPKLAYDHKEIVKTALERLRSKLEYSNIVYGLLPDEFTLTNLQKTYETILGKELDKRNFRKKILSLNILAETGKMESGQANRPAMTYRFKEKKPRIIEML